MTNRQQWSKGFMRRIRQATSDSAFRYAIFIFLVMRVLISLWAAMVLVITQAPTTPDEMLRPYQGIEPITGGPAELLLGVWQRFDTLWYLRIAAQGYARHDGSTVYFPLYPMLIRLLGTLFASNYLLAALVLAITRAPTTPANHRGHLVPLHPATVRNGIWEALPNSAFLGAEKLPEHPISDGKRLTCTSDAL